MVPPAVSSSPLNNSGSKREDRQLQSGVAGVVSMEGFSQASFENPVNCSMSKFHSSSPGSHPVSHSDETDGGNDDHDILGTSMGTARSTSIPLPASHVPKTKSELQLCIDEEAAEQRDARMFYRLVNGIRERQQQQVTETLTSVPCANSYEQSISRLVQARLAPLGEGDRPAMAHSYGAYVTETEQLEFPQEGADAWSISGYDQEDQTPFPPHGPNHDDQEEEKGEDSSPEEEGLFEMEL